MLSIKHDGLIYLVKLRVDEKISIEFRELVEGAAHLFLCGPAPKLVENSLFLNAFLH